MNGEHPDKQAPATKEKRAGLRIEYRAFLAAYNAAHLAQKSYEKAFRTAFPLGSEVQWMRGGFIQVGKVVMHGHGDRLKAENIGTGREVWVNAWSIREVEV